MMRHWPVWTDGNCTLWVGDGPHGPPSHDPSQIITLATGGDTCSCRSLNREPIGRADIAKLAAWSLAMLACALLAVVFVIATQ
jgi:hypothetical protein